MNKIWKQHASNDKMLNMNTMLMHGNKECKNDIDVWKLTQQKRMSCE